jgi:hypothetical protein
MLRGLIKWTLYNGIGRQFIQLLESLIIFCFCNIFKIDIYVMVKLT